MPDVEIAVGAEILASTNNDLIEKKRKRDILPRVDVVPGSYTAQTPTTTFGFLVFPQVTPGKIWEILRIGAYSGDMWDVLAGVTMVAFRTASIPQDSNNEPGVLGDLLAAGGQVPNTIYPIRYILARGNERVVLGFEGLVAGTQITASMDIIEHDYETFLRSIDEVD
jgi:hypothetical protein